MNEYEDLILKYLSNSTTPDENQKLLEWVQCSDENSRKFRSFCDAWSLAELSKAKYNYDSQKAFDEFKNLVNQNSENRKSHKTVLLTSRFVKVASGVAAVLVAFVLLNILVGNRDKFTQVSNVDSDERLKVDLPDSSSVFLEKGAKLCYSDDGRGVSLEGTAFFDVYRDTLNTFTVSTKNGMIYVLGTSFEVATFEDSTRIAVNSGKVMVVSDFDTLFVTKNEIAVSSDLSNGLLRKNVDVNKFSWFTNVLAFDNTKLDKVCADLYRHYSVDFDFAEASLKDKALTANYDASLPIDDVINIIAESLDLKIEKATDTKFTIRK